VLTGSLPTGLKHGYRDRGPIEHRTAAKGRTFSVGVVNVMSWNRKEPPIAIYVDDGTVPHSVPKGRVLMHNHVLHDADTPSGTNGFRGWTEPEPPPGFVQCHCGWAHGLPHYARADAAVTR
jgi:hypothetical protein